MTDFSQICRLCQRPSGTSLVCPSCRKGLTKYWQKKLTIEWHSLIVRSAYSPRRGKYQCHHCGEWFAYNEIIGDHFPETKAAAPELRYDLTAGVPSCGPCNTSGNPHRSHSLNAMKNDDKKPKQPKKKFCSEPHCTLLPLGNGKCVRHQPKR